MIRIINKYRMLLLVGISMLVIQSCATAPTGSRKDFVVPGCENAWNDIAAAHALGELKILVKNDCSSLYQRGWRLPIIGGNDIPDVCNPAWETLKEDGQLYNVRFMVTHNCPVFYRKGWIVPPT